MTESFFDRWTRAERRRIAGMSGKPEFRINIDITVPVAQEAPPVELAPLFTEQQEVAPDRVIRPTVTQLPLAPQLRDWLAVVRQIAGEKSIDIRDLWVRIDVRPESRCTTYTTNLGTMVLAYRDAKVVAGKLRLFVRFAAFAKVMEDGVSQLAVEGTKLNYVSGGEARTLEAADRINGEAFAPDAPQLTGYKMVNGFGLALREAAHFTKKRADVMGRHKVLVFPKNDSTGTVEVIGCGGTMNDDQAGIALIYRREVQAPDITTELYLEPLRALTSDALLDDNVGVALAGQDFVWLLAHSGFIIGMESVPSAVPDQSDLNNALQAPSGRIEFAPEEAAALRRAISQIRLSPETVSVKEISVRPRGMERVLEFGVKDSIQSVPCTGDMGPENICVNPDLLSHALTVRGVHAMEFDKLDAERPLVLVGPGVRVALKPLEVVK